MTGHHVKWTHGGWDDISAELKCDEPEGARCRVMCADSIACNEEGFSIEHDEYGPYHVVNGEEFGEIPRRHQTSDLPQCNIIEWLQNDDARFTELYCGGKSHSVVDGPIIPIWNGGGYEWKYADQEAGE